MKIETYQNNFSLLRESTSHPCLADFERRFSKTDHTTVCPNTAESPNAQETNTFKKLSEGRHMCMKIKNPRTLMDVMNWAQRDLYGFMSA